MFKQRGGWIHEFEQRGGYMMSLNKGMGGYMMSV